MSLQYLDAQILQLITGQITFIWIIPDKIEYWDFEGLHPQFGFNLWFSENNSGSTGEVGQIHGVIQEGYLGRIQCIRRSSGDCQKIF